LHPVTLLKLFVVSRSLSVEHFESSRYRIMSSANRDTLIISLAIFLLFLLLALLLWLGIPGLC
jgi:hypothetical protein